MSQYKPKRGDIVMMEFDPQSGTEMRGSHPALVISNTHFNARGSLAMVCPISTKTNGSPFDITLVTEATKVVGFVKTNQARSLDYKARSAKKIDIATPANVDLVSKYVQRIIES